MASISPFDSDPRPEGQLGKSDQTHVNGALKIVTDNNYCIKCHLVGDFAPAGSDRAKAPHLDQVYRRLRPEYIEAWVANPKRILPYTGMPVNIPFDKPVNQDLLKGDSMYQREPRRAVVELRPLYRESDSDQEVDQDGYPGQGGYAAEVRAREVKSQSEGNDERRNPGEPPVGETLRLPVGNIAASDRAAFLASGERMMKTYFCRTMCNGAARHPAVWAAMLARCC